MLALLMFLFVQPPQTFHLRVVGGSGSGDYACGAKVTIVAEKHHGADVFTQWFPGWDGETAVTRVHQRKAVLTMPACPGHDAVVEAKFTAKPPKRTR